MITKPTNCRGYTAWLAALLVAGLPLNAPAETAAELFAEGNRLFRDDLYWAALLRYEQARDAGYGGVLLDYNSGVAHYRAGQYRRARTAFLAVADDARQAPLAHYNLGLVARAAGHRDEAIDWFRRARDQERRPQVAALANAALAALEREPVEAVEDDAPAFVPAKLPDGLQLTATLGVGSDDNAYRSPDEPYNDRSQAGNPLVTPVVQSGVYYPLDLTARYSVGSFDNEAFYGRYRVAGRYYQDPALENANEFSHELAFGSRYHRRSENRERKIHSAFTIAQHDETWYDRDDGSERSLAGEPAGQRLSYMRFGPELMARQSFSRLTFGVHGKGQIWNYESVAGLPEYDHEFLEAGLSAQYRFTSTSLIRVEGEVAQRRFGDRPAREADGSQPLDNPALRYDYVTLGALARQRVTRHFWFGVRYARTERTDRHVGYNDYLRDSYGAEFSLRIADRFKLRAEAWYRIYNYVRALAYHDPGAGRKTLETADARVTARWQLTPRLGLVGRYDYRDTASNDQRVDYTRGQFTLGLEWQQ